MQEYELVEDIVQNLLKRLDHVHVSSVEAVYFRRGGAISETAMRKAYNKLTLGTPLERAKIFIETLPLEYICTCGNRHAVNSEDLYGRMFVCPYCGTLREIKEANTLELVEVDVVEPERL
jgi:Zn finger protein HypA/HybF involved in hydrogenase expression